MQSATITGCHISSRPPHALSIIRAIGSTNKGHVTANPPNVQHLRAHIGLRRMFIQRSNPINNGWIKKNAPQTKNIFHEPIAIKAINAWAIALAANAATNPSATLRRASGT